MKKIVAIIPARFGSSRFPGKPLALINGKAMIQMVYEQVSKVENLASVIVATDDERIMKKVKSFGGNVVMTSRDIGSGTDRLAEVAANLEHVDVIINIQGDEPLIQKEMIQQLIYAFDYEDTYMATLKKKIGNSEDVFNPNIVKVITDLNDYAIYFSRSPIPFDRDKIGDAKYYKHIGIYGYSREFLLKISKLPQTPLELIEKLEQLRVIENGYKIKVLETKYESLGVDLPEHVALVEEYIKMERRSY